MSIAFVRFKATDFEKSKAFYASVLGFGHGKAGCKGVRNPCFVINQYQHVELIKAQAGDSGSFVDEIGFTVFGVKQMQQYLTSHGVKTSKISRGRNRRQFFVVEDPEGHHIAFVGGPGIVEPWSDDAVHINLNEVSSQIIHGGFVVRDRAAEDHFYKDILGFRPYWHGGMKDDKDDWVAMQVPDGTDWVEYMLNISPTADKHTLGVMNHIALGVEDIHETEKRLIANGWKPGEKPKIGRDGKWQLNLYDPDDTRIEFMEFTPKEKPCCSDFTGPHPGPKK
jgi:catechol 2,3-dioxygenase-like lactoylglutathione lyase family enzyme